MKAEILTYALVAGLAIAVLYAGFTDVRHRRISNVLTATIALASPLFWLAADLSFWPSVAIQIGMAAATFLLGAVLFRLGQVGGGDVKLLSAIALCMAPKWYLYLILFTGLFNGVLTVTVAARHRRARRAGKAKGRAQVPYAVSVAAAMMLVLSLQYAPMIDALLVNQTAAS